MKVRHTVSVLLVAIAMLGIWMVSQPAVADDLDPQKVVKKQKTRYIAIVMVKDETREDGRVPCRVVPFHRHVKSGDRVKILNLTEHKISFVLPDTPDKPRPFKEQSDFDLEKGETTILEVKDGIDLLNYGYNVSGKCLIDYPGPFILIP